MTEIPTHQDPTDGMVKTSNRPQDIRASGLEEHLTIRCPSDDRMSFKRRATP